MDLRHWETYPHNHRVLPLWHHILPWSYFSDGCFHFLEITLKFDNSIVMHRPCHIMTSSNGSIFRVTGPLRGESTGHQGIPSQRPVTRNFDYLFDVCLNKQLMKQSRRRWFETPSRSLWHHCNGNRYFGSRSQQMPDVIMSLFLLNDKCNNDVINTLCVRWVQLITKSKVHFLFTMIPFEFCALRWADGWKKM